MHKHFLLFLGLSLLACATPKEQAGSEPWQPLFDGRSLQGWHKLGGAATYRVEDDQIIGTTAANTPNTFLVSDRTYGDFILELDIRLEGETNSGIQIRSNSFPEYRNGVVHGYQVEIDPSARAWSGGLYDEQRRGWLNPLADMPEAQQAYRQGEWNHLRIEAIGDTFKVWMNDVPTTHFVDDQTGEGFIGLQVHSVEADKVGLDTYWRNVRIITENPRRYSRPMPLPVGNKYNQLTSNETNDGWKLLWDGKTSTGWRGAKMQTFPTTGWAMADGILTIHESGGGESASAGDIITNELYDNFIFDVDFRLTPGANSGIKYFVDPELNKGEGSAIGLEYQLLDDERHPDAKLGSRPGSRTLASLYDLYAAENRPEAPIGEWNHARIVVSGKEVEHWLNGRRVVTYNRSTPEFRERVAGSKYHIWPGFGEWPRGHILLQDHGNTVSFRNIRIKTLN